MADTLTTEQRKEILEGLGYKIRSYAKNGGELVMSYAEGWNNARMIIEAKINVGRKLPNSTLTSSSPK